MTRAHLDKAPAEVAAMFDDVAPRYDITNTVLSMGQDRGWRRVTSAAVGLQPGELALDLAAGTGTSSVAIAEAGGRVVACDFSLGMLRAGAPRHAGDRVVFVAGDAERLPFRDRSFDAVSISFGLRNVSDVPRALAEMHRVTRPGGRLVVCEFSHPTYAPFRRVYLEYLMRALPALAERVSSSPDAYSYLAESIRAWPDQPGLARLIEASGWDRVAWRDLTFGIVAIHRARRLAGA